MSEDLSVTEELLVQIIDSSLQHHFPQQCMDTFKVLNAAPNKLFQDAEQLALSLTSIRVALEQQPLLPQAMHNHIVADQKLNKIQKILEDMNTSFLPHKIVEDPDSMSWACQIFVYSPLCIQKVTDPVKKRMVFIDLRLQTITYSMADHQPTHQKWRVPNLKAVKDLDYLPPAPFTSGKGFFICSPANAGYDKFTNTGIDISEHSRILILQKDSLTPAQCPDLKTWKARAKRSAGEQEFECNSVLVFCLET
ncbi:hypothetical protein DFH08DRAFT_823211 [Mycena albidolilacea]|uniref:Uncharacterized protein n=1 Tax=Mycena albidolilacea TaxID=1033008 RepID=A0AAD6Z6T4_9AGAR|nr:hypothetical protein DFH08DRAFT_823211 [Mycena albidolilacea]